MIFLTGGCGFIGSAFLHHWLANEAEPVLNLDALTYAGQPANVADLAQDPRYQFCHGDINDAALLTRLLHTHQPRAVLHLAAETHVDRSLLGPLRFAQTNALGTLQLLTAVLAYWQTLDASAAQHFRFLHVSTDEVFGSLAADAPPSTEASPYQPNNSYAASKAAADHFVRAFHTSHGLPTLTTHSSNNYGERQHPEKLIPRLIGNALRGQALPVYGDGQQRRDWLYVGDHCRALCRVLAAGEPGQTYNIGGGNERSNLAVVQQVCGLLDALAPRQDARSHHQLIAHVQDRPGHDARYRLNCEKIQTQLSWQVEMPFDQGLARTVQWALAQQGRA
ncbi:MAG: dTDP-glucose 4,6-dehydratase [Burkholderiaceae bacterium]